MHMEHECSQLINSLLLNIYWTPTAQETWNSERTQQRHGPYPLGTCDLKQFRLQLVTIRSGCDCVDKTKPAIQSISGLQCTRLLTTLSFISDLLPSSMVNAPPNFKTCKELTYSVKPTLTLSAERMSSFMFSTAPGVSTKLFITSPSDSSYACLTINLPLTRPWVLEILAYIFFILVFVMSLLFQTRFADEISLLRLW